MLHVEHASEARIPCPPGLDRSAIIERVPRGCVFLDGDLEVALVADEVSHNWYVPAEGKVVPVDDAIVCIEDARVWLSHPAALDRWIAAAARELGTAERALRAWGRARGKERARLLEVGRKAAARAANPDPRRVEVERALTELAGKASGRRSHLQTLQEQLAKARCNKRFRWQQAATALGEAWHREVKALYLSSRAEVAYGRGGGKEKCWPYRGSSKRYPAIWHNAGARVLWPSVAAEERGDASGAAIVIEDSKGKEVARIPVARLPAGFVPGDAGKLTKEALLELAKKEE